MPATWLQASVRTLWPIQAWPVLPLLGLGLGRALVLASLGAFNPLGPAPSIDLGHGSPICSPRRRRRALAPSPAPAPSSVIVRTPRGKRCPKWKRRRLQMGLPPRRSSQSSRYALSTFDLPERRVLFFYSFWDSGLEREGDLALRDLSAAPPCVEGWSEEELSKLFHFSKVLGMPVEGHEVEILALLRN
ncbi:hypothetical protein CK203_035397 [Vitis vinifera]|uniref:Uncharacterized protein n=1 Tax=Vitis vinifera TaxID=29760 RepID=A0A438I3R2_VITVI|nr:hypothetical protein CK203_035397 [Vitis vinifera]